MSTPDDELRGLTRALRMAGTIAKTHQDRANAGELMCIVADEFEALLDRLVSVEAPPDELPIDEHEVTSLGNDEFVRLTAAPDDAALERALEALRSWDGSVSDDDINASAEWIVHGGVSVEARAATRYVIDDREIAHAVYDAVHARRWDLERSPSEGAAERAELLAEIEVELAAVDAAFRSGGPS